jgi:carboxymethylenebutenolidase
MSDMIKVRTGDGSFGAYAARPATLPAPAIVVIQEIFGINADMRQACDEMAAQGYLAVCPDLFWRLEPGIVLSADKESDLNKALSLYTAFDIDRGVSDIAATMDAARKLPGTNGKVGVVGFCLGGLMTFLTAARKGADAAVAYYGGRTNEFIAEAKGLRAPLLMHLAEEDEYIDKAAQKTILAALKDRPNAKVYTYPGCNHAFARHNGAHFNAAAAASANARTAAFFKANLA